MDASFDVVALVASAGGIDALGAVLADLPGDFPASVVVAQHIGGQTSRLAELLARRTALPVAWATDGARIEPGHVLVAPPGRLLEVLPDRTCGVRPGAPDRRPFDFLLTSIADAVGARGLGAVLTGMGRDGVEGARMLKQRGGVVIVQSEDTAEAPGLPRAVADAGAADLVLPRHEIGRTIAEVVAGRPLPTPRSELEAVERLFAGPGPARAELRAIDWATTPLGPVSGWSTELRAIVRTALDSPVAMVIAWGPDFVQIYNDEGRRTGYGRARQGQPLAHVFADLWEDFAPMYRSVLDTGTPFAAQDALIMPEPGRRPSEFYATFSISPLQESGRRAGVLVVTHETTDQVLGRRRITLLRALDAAGRGDHSAETAEGLATVFAGAANDVPFALVYLTDAARTRATLSGAAGVDPGATIAPRTVDLRGGHPVWPLAKAIRAGEAVEVADLLDRLPGFHAGPWPEPPERALVMPLGDFGALVLGVSARLDLDTDYGDFLRLAGAAVEARLAAVRTAQRERERLERMAELDRVKTEFFANVSHEFRTPLTLLLAPLEELAHHRAALPPPLGQELEVATHSARRLVTLVDSLLHFSRAEAGRLRMHFEPVDLAADTVDIASMFRAAAERVGVELRVDCPPLDRPVWVDREAWDTIVSNLLANALKFTFSGEVVVELRTRPRHAELVVRDTGVGIPEDQLPYLFQRFHRVPGTRGRTHEGVGIGLALVHELVGRHQGRVRVASTVDEGSTFTVWMPLGERPATGDRPPVAKPGSVAAALAEEAARWAEDRRPPEAVVEPLAGANGDTRPAAARVLVADDNADMRDYLARLLGEHWQVRTAADGDAALAVAEAWSPELIVTDVMMPGTDGLDLLERLRAHAELMAIPVVLVTARGGSEAAIEGLLAGADDYVEKPFSARELVARVGAQLELARTRARSRALVQTTVDAAPVLMMALDPQGRATFLNEELRTFLGYDGPVGEFAFADYNHPDDLPAIVAELERGLAEGREVSYECRARRADGVYEWLYATVRPLLDERGAAAGQVATGVVISDRKRREAHAEFLREVAAEVSRPHTEDVIDAIAVRLARHLGVNRVAVSRVDFERELAESIYSYAPDGEPSLGMHTFAELGEAFTAKLRDGRPFVFENRRVDPVGRGPSPRGARYGLESVALVQTRTGDEALTLAVSRSTEGPWDDDVIELLERLAPQLLLRIQRQQSAETLRASEARFRALFEAIDEGYTLAELVRDETGEVVDLRHLAANPAVTAITGIADYEGLRLSDIEGKAPTDLLEIATRVAATGVAERHTRQLPAIGRRVDFHISPVEPDRLAVVFRAAD